MDSSTQTIYFTPDLEDLRVGYECVIKVYGEEDKWVKTIFSTPDFTSVLSKDSDGNYFVPDCLKVPYLTKEQIEAEGWGIGGGLADFEKTKPILWSVKRFNNQTYDLQYNFDTRELTLARGIVIVFRAQCKDINTFRLICKMIVI